MFDKLMHGHGNECPGAPAFSQNWLAVDGIEIEVHRWDRSPVVVKAALAHCARSHDATALVIVSSVAEAVWALRLPRVAKTGAKGAITLDMGLTPEQGKALTLIGRTAGLMAHIIEEQRHPLGQQVWDMAAEKLQA